MQFKTQIFYYIARTNLKASIYTLKYFHSGIIAVVFS